MTALMVIEAAKAAAAVFYGETGRAYSDADDGNWDAEAWAQAASKLGLSNEEQDALWPGFARVLREETRRLAA